MYTLTKNFRFESAHRLAKGYVGACSNIHGHSFTGHLALEIDGTDKHDMAVDYKDMGAFLKDIEKQLDHKVLLCDEDKELIDLCRKKGWEVVVFEDNPTSETLAKYIFEQAEIYFAPIAKQKALTGVRITKGSVTINETCTTSCTYTKNN